QGRARTRIPNSRRSRLPYAPDRHFRARASSRAGNRARGGILGRHAIWCVCRGVIWERLVWSHRGEYLAYLYRLDADTLGSIRHRRFAYTRDLAKEHAMKIDDEAQYLAFTALTTETQRQR